MKIESKYVSLGQTRQVEGGGGKSESVRSFALNLRLNECV